MVTSRSLVGVMVTLLYWVTPVLAEQITFSVNADVTQAEYGKSFNIILSTESPEPSLTSVDLSALGQDFIISDTGDIELDGRGNQSRRVKLYARKQGVYFVPSLHYAGAISKPIAINITGPLDPKTRKPIDISFSFMEKEIWVKQQFIIKATLISEEQYMVLKTGQPSVGGMQTVVMQHVVHDDGTDTDKKFRHEIGWVLMAMKPGNMTVQLPAVQFYRDGVNTHDFYPPPVSLKVKALPSYIPGTMPVGKLSLASMAPTYPWLLLNHLHEYRFVLDGNGIPAAELPVINLRADRQADITFYPPAGNTGQAASHSGLSSRSEQVYPIAATASGLVTLPGYHLQYFDPDTGRIRQASVAQATFIALPGWLAVLVLLTTIIFSGYLLRLILNWSARRWKYYRSYLAAIRKIKLSDKCSDYRDALQQVVCAEGWQSTTTLAQLESRWRNMLPAKTAGIEGVSLLARKLYRGDTIEAEEIGDRLLLLLRARRPILKIFT